MTKDGIGLLDSDVSKALLVAKIAQDNDRDARAKAKAEAKRQRKAAKYAADRARSEAGKKSCAG